MAKLYLDLAQILFRKKKPKIKLQTNIDIIMEIEIIRCENYI